MRTYLPVILLMLIGRASFGQSINTAEKSSQVRKTTRLQFAVKLYRDGLKLMQGVQPVSSGDYHKAYSLFKQAADMGDAQSLFARSYLEFKHLGTDRSDCYESAAKGFFQGALAGRDNSMYFYGLCLANGYGVVKNVDSAKYWLQKSAATGYKQAIEELKRPHAENANDSASSLLDKINQSLLPKNRPINEFVLIEPQIPASSIIAGHYTGYVLHFDWSGKYLISSEPLELSLENSESESEVNGSIKGLWTEKGGTPVPINATLSNDSVIFKQTEYKIKDHYSWDKEITYDFNSASLSLNQEGDSVFLYGNVQMYSPERGEPAKPIYLALVRTDYISSQTKDSLAATNRLQKAMAI